VPPLVTRRPVSAAGSPQVELGLGRSSSGAVVQVRLSIAQPTTDNLGAHPILLQDGQVSAYDRADPMLADPEPRSIVAWKGRGTTWHRLLRGRSTSDVPSRSPARPTIGSKAAASGRA